jgi:flagellar biosynthesis chaperone FliJ
MSTPTGGETEHPGRWLRVVRRDDFARLMGRAIEAALVRRGGLAPERARLLRADALERFTTLFGVGARRVRAQTKNEVLQELERTHGELLRQRQQWNGELEGLQQELVRARERETAASTLSAPEEAALEGALSADLERLLASSDPRAALGGVLARERERRATALAGVVRRERERIDQLERRMSKLRAEVARMEQQLAELARRAELDPGLPSIYDSVQGLSAEEAERAAKAQMLTVIFEQNLKLQNRA